MNIKELNLNEVATDDLKEFLVNARVELKNRRETEKAEAKANKEADRDAANATGKAAVEAAGKGATITFDYHGEETTGVIAKWSDKTVSVIITENGEDKTIWRYFYQVKA